MGAPALDLVKYWSGSTRLPKIYLEIRGVEASNPTAAMRKDSPRLERFVFFRCRQPLDLVCAEGY